MEEILKHRQHLNETISNQAKQIEILNKRIELGKQDASIHTDTIGKLFAAAKKDKERIKILEERIEILNHSIEIDKITIKTQEDTIKIYMDNLKK